MSDPYQQVKDTQRLISLMQLRHNRKAMGKIHTGGFALAEHPDIDDYGTVTLGTWRGYLIQVVPMLFNDRLVMSPKRCPEVYDFGWCFERGGAAYLSAAVWHPATEGEPKGFIKRVGPQREPGEDVNHDDLSHGEAAALAIFGTMAAVTSASRR